jgi:folate-binding Fe-S cluster repair protein YgfZ
MTDEETLKEVAGIIGAVQDAPSQARKLVAELGRYKWFALNTLAVCELEPTTLADSEKVAYILREWKHLKQQEATVRQAELFVTHIKEHLATTPELAGQEVCCKICGKTIDEISKEETN